MTVATQPVDAIQSTDAPHVAHAWCTCHERDGIVPIPSLCGQATKTQTPEATAWPDDMQNCVLCDQMVKADEPCPRCGGR